MFLVQKVMWLEKIYLLRERLLLRGKKHSQFLVEKCICHFDIAPCYSVIICVSVVLKKKVVGE